MVVVGHPPRGCGVGAAGGGGPGGGARGNVWREGGETAGLVRRGEDDDSREGTGAAAGREEDSGGVPTVPRAY